MACQFLFYKICVLHKTAGVILENMRIVNKDVTDEDIIDALKQACAYEFVEILPDGIYSKMGQNGSGFSEGQIQRLAIARALLSRAPIILLDEATSALDSDTESKILHNVIEKNRCRTLIFVTHRLGILPVCNRVYRIEQKSLKTVSLDETIDNSNECEH
jgi:ABC-type multidrug transport system fused ATPase/permease subunit